MRSLPAPNPTHRSRRAAQALQRALLCLAILLGAAKPLSAQSEGIPEGFTSLFNGEDLTGWHVSRTNHHGTVGNFSVEDGAIVLKQHPFGQGGILLTDTTYDDFELYWEFKGDAGTDGGVLFRSNESGSAYQLQIGGAGHRGTGRLMGELLRVTTTATAEKLDAVWRDGEWNAFRLCVVGVAPHVTLWVNGVQMWAVQAERNNLIADATGGMIALQLHWSQTPTPVPGGSCCAYSWRPGAAHRYRHIAIKEL
jgi:hypothetical protein